MWVSYSASLGLSFLLCKMGGCITHSRGEGEVLGAEPRVYRALGCATNSRPLALAAGVVAVVVAII